MSFLDKVSSFLHNTTTSVELDQVKSELNALTIGLSIGIVLFLIAGLVIGYFVAVTIMKKTLKKNPPISKDTIRMIYSQVGRKPSETQINEIYNRAIKQK